MTIDLKTISQLREKTGAGIGDCKAALEEAAGNLDQAVELLRKKGEIKAAKKSDRATSEGVIALAKGAGKIAVVALACETDFVALTDDFKTAVANLAQELLADETDFRARAEQKIKEELVVKIGENLRLADFGVFAGEVIGSYLHSNNKAAAVVVLSGDGESLANDLAMQVVAMSPQYLDPSGVPTEVIAKETEIYREQLAGENKPAEIIEKIIAGKLAKFYEENCLLYQIYIKDDSKKIIDLMLAVGDNISIKEFKKFQL